MLTGPRPPPHETQMVNKYPVQKCKHLKLQLSPVFKTSEGGIKTNRNARVFHHWDKVSWKESGQYLHLTVFQCRTGGRGVGAAAPPSQTLSLQLQLRPQPLLVSLFVELWGRSGRRWIRVWRRSPSPRGDVCGCANHRVRCKVGGRGSRGVKWGEVCFFNFYSL